VRLAESDADERRQEARLMTYKGIAAEGEGEADGDAEGGGAGGKGGAGEAGEAGWAEAVSWEDAQRLGVTELRPLLRRLGLSASGRKAELLDRLRGEMEERGRLGGEAEGRLGAEEGEEGAAAVGLEESFFGEPAAGEAAAEEDGEAGEEGEVVAAPKPRFVAPHKKRVVAPSPPVTATATAWGYPGVGGRFNGGSGVAAWDSPGNSPGRDPSARIPPPGYPAPGYPARGPGGGGVGGGGPASAAASAPARAVPPPPVPDEAQEAEGGAGRVRDAVFERSIVDYLRAEGGEASSRNVGRTHSCNPTLQPHAAAPTLQPKAATQGCNSALHLRAATQSCKPAPPTPPSPPLPQVGRHLAAKGLLRPLKGRYAGLFHFLQQRSQATPAPPPLPHSASCPLGRHHRAALPG